ARTRTRRASRGHRAPRGEDGGGGQGGHPRPGAGREDRSRGRRGHTRPGGSPPADLAACLGVSATTVGASPTTWPRADGRANDVELGLVSAAAHPPGGRRSEEPASTPLMTAN